MEERTYYVIEITTVNGQTAKAIWDQATLEGAKAQFHQIMASAWTNENCTSALAMIINDLGFCEVMERKPAYVEE